MTGITKPREEPITPYLRGFTRSRGARRRKASPTGPPDKPDQKEHTEGKGGSSGLHEGWEWKSHEANNQTSTSPHHPLSTSTQTDGGSNKDALGQQHCWGWHRYNSVCFSSFGLTLHLSSCPALSASQWLLLCPGCQGCTSSGCRRQGICGGLTISRLNTSLWYSPDDPWADDCPE